MVNLLKLSEEEACRDESSKRDKEIVMREQRKTSKYFSISETFQFISAVMLPLGLGFLLKEAAVITAASTQAAAAATAATAAATTATAATAATAGGVTIGSLLAAFSVPMVAVFMGAAALCVGIAITSRYVASRHLHNATFNSSEINAQHCAKYMAKELSHHHEHNCRADGKAWATVVAQQSSQLTR